MGVDPDRLFASGGASFFLNGVPDDEDFSADVRLGEVEAFPVKVAFFLLRKGEGGVDSSVDDEVGVSLVVGEEAVKEAPVLRGDLVDEGVVVEAEGGEGFVAAVDRPEFVVLGAEGGIFHHEFMVPTEGDEGRTCAVGVVLAELDEAVDDSSGIGATVNVVTDGDEGVFWAEGKGVVEGVEGGKATVNVTDDVGFHEVRGVMVVFFSLTISCKVAKTEEGRGFGC